MCVQNFAQVRIAAMPRHLMKSAVYGWRNGANSQSLYSFTFNAVIVIHEYIYSHSTTKFTFKKYIYSHLQVSFLFTIIFAHIHEMS